MWFSQKWWPWPWLLSDFKKKNLGRFWTRIHHMSKNQDDRSSGVACTSRTDGRTDTQTDRQTDRQTDERALRECILCKIGLTDWVAYLVDWQWQRSRTQSIGPNDSNERCAISRVLFRINIAAITENTWPWPFTSDLDLFPWPLTLIFDLETDLLLPWCFEENITKMYCFDVTWRKNGTSYVRTETNLLISILSVSILQPTRTLYGFRFQSYGSKGDFNGFWCVWHWPWHFKVIWFLWIRHLFPCMTGVNFEAISSLIAEI